MPTSHHSPSGHESTGVSSPPIVCPSRSSVIPSAPITIPLFGQLVRSLVSVVSAVIVAPIRSPAPDRYQRRAAPPPPTPTTRPPFRRTERSASSARTPSSPTPFVPVAGTPPKLRSGAQQRQEAHPGPGRGFPPFRGRAAGAPSVRSRWPTAQPIVNADRGWSGRKPPHRCLILAEPRTVDQRSSG